MECGIILGGNLFNGKKVLTSQKKNIRLMAVSNLEIHAEVYLKDYKS
jgi:hypothetical protein